MADNPERDDVGRLIRMAGRRPAPPPDAAARVKAAVHEEWLDAVRRRRRRRIGWGAALLAAAASAALFASLALRGLPGTGQDEFNGLLVESAGAPAWLDNESAAASDPLEENERLTFGASASTGENGHLALRLPDGGSVRLDAGSKLLAVDAATFVLQRGAVYVDSGGHGIPGGVAIRTPYGTVREIGTQYEVRLVDDGLRVRVREGSVSLNGGGETHEVAAASELTVDTQGAVSIRQVAIHGPDWDWVARSAKLPNMRGRSARAFLEYVARERGWVLRFANAETERAAGTTRLSGSLERLSLDDALDAVLPTCGMTYTIGGGTLVVSLAGIPAGRP